MKSQKGMGLEVNKMDKNVSKLQALRRRIGFENLRIIISATLFVGMFVAIGGTCCTSKAVMLIGFLLEGAAIVMMLIFWRCPHCGRLQGRLFEVGDYCTYCGGRLDDSEEKLPETE